MSDLTPHLRVLRAQEAAWRAIAANPLFSADNRDAAQLHAAASQAAADQLEAEEVAMQSRFINREQTVHYNPKGKP